jgi:hypothetical protein
MCFSATASFVAGGALTAAGLVTARQVKTNEQLPFALMPLLFGIQQLIEGVVWVTAGMPWLQGTAAFAFVMFSHVIWPTYVPFAVLMLEPAGRRRTALKVLLLIGVSISLWLYIYATQRPVEVALTGRGCVYDVNVPAIPYGLAAYVLVTCASCLISRHKFVRLLGVSLIGALGLALFAYQQAFYSVWCFFAAILSLMIYLHLTGAGEVAKRRMRRAVAQARETVERQLVDR